MAKSGKAISKLVLKIKKISDFQTFIKRISSVDKMLHIQVNSRGIESCVFNRNDAGNFLKYASIPATQFLNMVVFDSAGVDVFLYTSQPLEKLLKYYSDKGGECRITITYDTVTKVATKLTFSDARLTKSTDTSMKMAYNKRIVGYSAVEMLSTSFDEIDMFQIDSETISMLHKLINDDGDDDKRDSGVEIVSDDAGIFMRGDSFEYVLSQSNSKKYVELYLKNHLYLLDKGDYSVKVVSKGIFFELKTECPVFTFIPRIKFKHK